MLFSYYGALVSPLNIFPFYFTNLFLTHYPTPCLSASDITIDAFSEYIYFYSRFNWYFLKLIMFFQTPPPRAAIKGMSHDALVLVNFLLIVKEKRRATFHVTHWFE